MHMYDHSKLRSLEVAPIVTETYIEMVVLPHHNLMRLGADRTDVPAPNGSL